MKLRAVYLVLLGLTAMSARAQEFIWTGAARCELNVTAAGYQAMVAAVQTRYQSAARWRERTLKTSSR